jgi:hypothetical protein
MESNTTIKPHSPHRGHVCDISCGILPGDCPVAWAPPPPAPVGSPEWLATCTPAERRRHRRGKRWATLLATLLSEQADALAPVLLEVLAEGIGRLVAELIAEGLGND